jgi:choline dehydrogenase-like flavoprotein
VNYIIGSGPAGVAAAAALVQRGLPVTMLDAGGELEPDLQAIAARLGQQLPELWDVRDRERLQGPLRLNAEGAPLKLAFGSDYVYRDIDRLLPVVADGVDAYRAVAAGGLSVVWGAAILPYSDDDFEGWPIDTAAMQAYYVAALELTGLAGEDDGIARFYPLHVAPTSSVELSSQARFVKDRMTRHAAQLERQHIHFGGARLAIGADPSGVAHACVHCGMCLYGCPYGLIYSAQATLKTRLAASRHFTYVPGYIVKRLTEGPDSVAIEAVSRDSLQPQRFEASRVYLAAGVLSSTAILLESLGAYSQPLELPQSEHFLLPLVLRGAAGRASRQRLHTLSQMFVEIRDRALSRHGIHLQLYTYNDLYARMAKDRLGPLYPLLAPTMERVIDRLVVIKGYLHSEESSRIRATLEPRDGGSALRLTAVPEPRSDATIRAVLRLLASNSKRIGAFPLRLGFRKGLPGSGIHVGGSFPMRRDPKRLESDVLGRPVGFTRVHAVDSAVFPTVPAAPPTLTIMANAYRITALSQAVEKDAAWR